LLIHGTITMTGKQVKGIVDELEIMVTTRGAK
jgi:hypothetical protein